MQARLISPLWNLMVTNLVHLCLLTCFIIVQFA